MRKVSLLLALLLLIFVFSACGSGSQNTTTTDESTEKTTVESTGITENQEDVVRIAIDKNSLANPENFVKSMKDYGAEVNDIEGADGYLLVFSKADHAKLLKEKKADVINKFKEYEDNQEHYVESIEYDDDFRNLKIYVNKDLYETTGSTTGDIVVASAALSYQMYLEDGQKTVVDIIYSGTEDVVSNFTLPMNLSIAQ